MGHRPMASNSALLFEEEFKFLETAHSQAPTISNTNNVCNTALVHQTITKYITPRLAHLLPLSNSEESTGSETPPLPVTFSAAPQLLPQPISGFAPSNNVDSRFQTSNQGVLLADHRIREGLKAFFRGNLGFSKLPEQAEDDPDGDLLDPDAGTTILPLISDVHRGGPVNYRVQLRTSCRTGFSMCVDTGSMLLWLRSTFSDPTSVCKHLPPLYTPKHKSVDTIDYDYSYADTSVTVRLYRDSISVGTLTAQDQLIGAAPVEIDQAIYLNSDFQAHGVLGLALSPPGLEQSNKKKSGKTEKIPPHGTLVRTLTEQKMIGGALVALVGPNVAGATADRNAGSKLYLDRGWLVMGWHRPPDHEGLFQPLWCPVLPKEPTQPLRWVIHLDEVKINGKRIAKGQKALVDSGTPYIIASRANFKKVRKEMEGVKIAVDDERATQFAYGGSGGFVLRNMEFVIRSGESPVTLSPRDCTLGAAPVTDMRRYYDANTSGIFSRSPGQINDGMMISSITRIAADILDKDMWVLGGIFLDNVITLFDNDYSRVGFLQPSQEALQGYIDQLTTGSTVTAQQPQARPGQIMARL